MDAINKTVVFSSLDSTHTIGVTNPAEPYNIARFVQGKTIITPTGNKITQSLYEGFKISLTWQGLSIAEYAELKDFIERHGHEGFIFESPDNVTYKCVVDGLITFTSSIKYVRLSGKLKYPFTLKLITIP